MTSSLVGSEMCIRDRGREESNSSQLGFFSHLRAARCADAWPQLPSQQAVSYTHLTLPTICSV
eukprot:10007958-Prorocentrum_lima.AAC.1